MSKDALRGAARKAVEACRALVEAYDKGSQNGDCVDWSDIDAAVSLALQALGLRWWRVDVTWSLDGEVYGEESVKVAATTETDARTKAETALEGSGYDRVNGTRTIEVERLDD